MSWLLYVIMFFSLLFYLCAMFCECCNVGLWIVIICVWMILIGALLNMHATLDVFILYLLDVYGLDFSNYHMC